MFLRSIRFKIVLWYMLFLMVTLSIFSFLLYESFNKALFGDLDDLLFARADGVAQSIAAYHQARRGIDAGVGVGATRMSADDFIAFARPLVEGSYKDAELMSIGTAILDPKGNKILTSKSAVRLEGFDEDDLEDLMDGEDVFAIVTGMYENGKKKNFRLCAKPITEDGAVRYIVRAAAPIDLLSLALGSLRVILFILLPLTVLLAGIPGVLLVRLTLRPVDRMIDTLRQITAENLKLKIHIPDTRDEIRRLADTFNEMIGRLDRSFSSQQRFIREISYDLKEPLDELRREIELMTARAHSPEEERAVLVKVAREAERFSRIIDELIALSRFDVGQAFLVLRKVDLCRLVEEGAVSAKKAAAEKGVLFSISCQAPVVVDGDEEQLVRLFGHLFDNAIKYTGRKGEIAVRVWQEAGVAKVSVIDTGIGIPEDELPYIFDSFYQVKRSRAQESGFGLGLSIAKSIAEAHKGSIAVESRPGEGSTFTAMIPLSYPA